MTSEVPVLSRMDPDPGRCRRTDGRKWRCRLAVLPDRKYCERHVNRGRQRSRKHVEAGQSVLKSKPTATAFIPNLGSAAKTNAIKHTKVGIKDQSFKMKKPSKESCAPHDISFFHESVIQHGKVPTSSSIHSSDLAVAESARCRRSDGKNWQCSKRALANQKYCMQHMHRGTEKAVNSQNSNTSLPFEVGVSSEQKGDDGNRPIDSSSSSDDNGGCPNGAVLESGSDTTTVSI
uniref:growth-regulating factor 6-like n=1 Tax=Erigeron canadensis TaxID=72917 RepID=UPI001CB9A76E|nr:growth-regulating factor 6-like [Erigeron canadensis]